MPKFLGKTRGRSDKGNISYFGIKEVRRMLYFVRGVRQILSIINTKRVYAWIKITKFLIWDFGLWEDAENLQEA